MAQLSHGMNTEEVEALGRYLQGSCVDQLKALSSDLDRSVRSATWAGRDADRFRQEWWPKHKSALDQIINALHGFGQSALNNASEQRQASGESVGGSSGPGGGGPGAPGGSGAPTLGGGGTATPAPPAAGSGEPGTVGGTSGVLPGANRTPEEVDAAYRNARGLGAHTYGTNRDYMYQCTAWAKLRWQELGYQGPLDGALGHGGAMAGNLGGTTDTPMKLGSMVSYRSGAYGHVMVVEEISPDGLRARVSEWNAGDRNYEVGHASEFRTDRWVTRDGGHWFDNGKILTIANLP